MKRSLLLILSLLLFVTFISTASADAGYDSYGTATVISTTCSIRESPDTRSTRLYKAKNMDQLVVTGEYYDWYVVDCYQSGLSATYQTGYVLKSFVVLNGYYIQLTGQSLDVYSDPWSGKKNGQKAEAGEVLFVIYETDQWLVVQLKTQERTPGTGFIRKSDIGWYTQQYQDPSTSGYAYPYTQSPYNFSDPNYYPRGYKGTYSGNEYSYYIAEWKIPVNKGWSVGIREVPDKDTKSLIIIHSGDKDAWGYNLIKVNVIYNLGQYAYVRIDDPKRPGGFVEGYVQTKYFESY